MGSCGGGGGWTFFAAPLSGRGMHLNTRVTTERAEYLECEIAITIVCCGMLFNCLRRTNEFPVWRRRRRLPRFTSCVTGVLGGVMQNMMSSLLLLTLEVVKFFGAKGHGDEYVHV